VVAAVARLGLRCDLDFGLLRSVQLGIAAAIVARLVLRCRLDFRDQVFLLKHRPACSSLIVEGGVMDGAPPLHLQPQHIVSDQDSIAYGQPNK
jgi:hypothetical protein